MTPMRGFRVKCKCGYEVVGRVAAGSGRVIAKHDGEGNHYVVVKGA